MLDGACYTVEPAAVVSLVVPFCWAIIFLGNISMICLCFPRVWIVAFELSILLESIGLLFNVEVLLAWPFLSAAESCFEFDVAPF